MNQLVDLMALEKVELTNQITALQVGITYIKIKSACQCLPDPG